MSVHTTTPRCCSHGQRHHVLLALFFKAFLAGQGATSGRAGSPHLDGPTHKNRLQVCLFVVVFKKEKKPFPIFFFMQKPHQSKQPATLRSCVTRAPMVRTHLEPLSTSLNVVMTDQEIVLHAECLQPCCDPERRCGDRRGWSR